MRCDYCKLRYARDCGGHNEQFCEKFKLDFNMLKDDQKKDIQKILTKEKEKGGHMAFDFTTGILTTYEHAVDPKEFTVKTTYTGNVYINGKYYRQCCFTANQIALAIEDYLNGIPADDEEEE